MTRSRVRHSSPCETPNLELRQRVGPPHHQIPKFGYTRGLTASYLVGDYGGSVGTLNPSYTQKTAGFLADYKYNGLSTEGQVAYSRRLSTLAGEDTQAFTGALRLKDQITAKTGLTFSVDRAINNYIPISGSELDTDAGVGVSGGSCPQTCNVSLGYTFSHNHRAFPQQAIDGSYPVDYRQPGPHQRHQLPGWNLAPRQPLYH